LPEGRTATENSLALQSKWGVISFVLTDNLKSGKTKKKIEQAITIKKKHFG
jgi:hypothetical protein